MRVLLTRQTRGFMPADAEAVRLHDHMKDGEAMRFEAVKIRSLPWHNMYFGICSEIGENQDPERDEDSIDHELRVLAGHYWVMFVGDVEVRIPKRIAFKRLTADQWAKLWPSLELAIRERFGEEYLREDMRVPA